MNLYEIFANKNTKVTKSIVEALEAPRAVQAPQDKNISFNQISLYDEAKEYIEKIVDIDNRVQDIVTLNHRGLTNYTIQFAEKSNEYIHVKDIHTGFVYGTFSLGNKKLKAGENTQFLIFNVLQRITCLNATEECLKFCYANQSNLKTTAKNSSSRNSRVNNLILSMFSNFTDIVNEVIAFVKAFSKKQIIFRFHEAGDIYSKEYYGKIKQVILSNPDVKFMFYTKTFFVLDDINELNKMENVSLRYSLDSSTNQHIIEKCNKLNCLTFIMINKQDTCKVAKMAGTENTCNLIKKDLNEIENKIQELETKLENELLKDKPRKTYVEKYTRAINSTNALLVDTERKCSSCMKCMNKDNIALFVGQHGYGVTNKK